MSEGADGRMWIVNHRRRRPRYGRRRVRRSGHERHGGRQGFRTVKFRVTETLLLWPVAVTLDLPRLASPGTLNVVKNSPLPSAHALALTAEPRVTSTLSSARKPQPKTSTWVVGGPNSGWSRRQVVVAAGDATTGVSARPAASPSAQSSRGQTPEPVRRLVNGIVQLLPRRPRAAEPTAPPRSHATPRRARRKPASVGHLAGNRRFRAGSSRRRRRTTPSGRGVRPGRTPAPRRGLRR